MKLITFVCAVFLCLPSLAQEKFPDGTPVSDWFKDSKIVDINFLILKTIDFYHFVTEKRKTVKMYEDGRLPDDFGCAKPADTVK